MTLVLQIENFGALDNGSPVQFTVPEQGAKVGRSASMDWILPDPTRHISSHHFDILVQGGAYYLRDMSTNGTYLHATRQRLDGFHQLRDGDRFQVGTFLICAAIHERTQIASPDQTVFMAQPSHAVPPADVPPAPPAMPTPPPVQPAAQPVAPQPPAPAPAPPPISAPQPAPVPPAAVSPAPPSAAIPDPEPPAPAPIPDPAPSPDPFAADPQDPFAAPIDTPAPAQTTAPEAPEERIPEDALLPDDFLDDILGSDPDEAPPAVEAAPEPTPESTPDTAPQDIPDDTPDAAPQKRDYSRIFEEVADRTLQKPPEADKTGFDDLSPVQAPPSVQIPDLDFIEPELSAPSIPPKSPQNNGMTGQLSLPPHQLLALERAAQEKAAETRAPDAILQAFCRGAGLPLDSATGVDPEALAEALGRSARSTADELRLMLEARASTKQFTRSGARTMRKATDSNPLKFMPDSEQALDAMYLKARDGYQSGPDAVKEALSDLRQHQTALFAAIQPALIAMLDGLSPEEIESVTEGGLMSGSGRSWDQYKALFAERTAGHDNGLLDVFLTHYAKAYGEMLGEDDD